MEMSVLCTISESLVPTCNLTAFNEATKQGHCFVWSETMAKRGSSEIGSCLLQLFADIYRTCQAFSPLFRLL